MDTVQMSFEDMFNEMLGEEIAPKKEKKKEPAKKSKTRKKEPTKVKLPIEVISAFEKNLTLNDVYGEKAETTIENIMKYLVEEGYRNLAHKDYNFLEKDGKLFLGYPSMLSASDANTQIDFSEGSVYVSDGMLNVEYTADSFPDKDDDEISLSDVTFDFVKLHPEYEGLAFNYDISSSVIIPIVVIPKKLDIYAKLDIPMMCRMYGENRDIEEISTLQAQATVEDFFVEQNLTAESPIAFVLQKCKNGYYLGCHVNGGSIDKSAVSSEKRKAKIVSEKYTLPLTVTLTGFDFELSPEDFDGKERVTQSDVEEYISPRYASLFRDPNRSPQFFYCKEANHLEILFSSGKKGGDFFSVLSHNESLEELLQRDCFYGILPELHPSNHMEQDMVIFMTKIYLMSGVVLSDGSYNLMSCRLRIPKIPLVFLTKIITYFRKDMYFENIVRIIYDFKEKGYCIQKPATYSSTHNSIDYTFERIPDYQKVVLTIHSHNTMPAFFSAVDNRDESCENGIYGVIGNLNNSQPSIVFRGCLNGSFRHIPAHELFLL